MNEHVLNKDYRDMIVCLLDAGVDFMLVGGYAVALEKLKARKDNG